MSLPSFLGPFTPLSQLLPPASPVGREPVPPSGRADSNQLSFLMQTQKYGNWCWAANASSVSIYFDKSSQWSQCAVAKCFLDNCCETTPDPCNVVYELDAPLRQTKNLQGAETELINKKSSIRDEPH